MDFEVSEMKNGIVDFSLMYSNRLWGGALSVV